MPAPQPDKRPNRSADGKSSPVNLCLPALLEYSEDAIACLDLDGTILSWNPGAAVIFGYTAQEMIGRRISSLAPPDCAPQDADLLEKIRSGEAVQKLETMCLRKGGMLIDVSLTVVPVYQGKRLVGASYIASDMTAGKRLEAAGAQLNALVESSEDAIVSTDFEGQIRTWNIAAERIFGFTAKEAIGRNMRWLTPAERLAEETGILEAVKRGERIDHFETVRVGPAGAVPVSLTIVPVRDGKGALLGTLYIAREITERRRLEAANAQLAAIVQSSEDAIVSKDLTGIIRTWNAGAERVYGWSAEEAIGHNISFLLPEERANEEQAILATLRRGERVEHFETTRLRKDGRLIDVSLGISPIRDSTGHITGASHVARDVTERKRFELQMQQAQRLESLGVLAGGIAHDFNNLLTGVIGNASLIAELLPPGDPVKPLVDDVTKAAERAASLTSQLLAYSGKGQFVIGPVDLDRLLEETSGLVRASISKNVAVVLDLHHNAPPVQGDQTQMHQLLMNLILNGAEAIGEDRPGTVRVRTGSLLLDEAAIRNSFPADRLAAGEFAVVEVRDDGCGMDEETRAKIFDPFFTTKFMGRGLGLAAALGIVNAHRGAIRVDSRPGEGSTFTVLLPASPATRHSNATAKATILVVDDEEIVRKTAGIVLEKHGYRILTATNGQEAIDLFAKGATQIDLLLLDLTMPVMGGEETLRRLREAGIQLPVVLSSGYTEADARRRFAADRLAGFIQKPYASGQLLEKLEKVLRQWESRA
jgi:two-component system, cell cycle sensor histidine kinase and response regulator CckA